MTSAEIDIYGPQAVLKGDFPLKEVREATSWVVEGYRFSKAYKKGLWDGRKHLFYSKTGAFPTGLLKSVCAVLDKHNITYVINDHRQEPVGITGSFDLEGVSFTGKYSYQLGAAKTMVEKKQGIVRIATGGGKTECACAVTKYLNLQTLFIVTTKELLYQSQSRFATRLGVDINEIGIIGDGHWKPGDWVTIAILDTLESRINTPECQRFLEGVEVVFIDECHKMGSDTWYTVVTLCPAYFRFGLSGTPLDRSDGANLRLVAATGDIIVDIGNKMLVDLGISPRADIIFDKVTLPTIPKRTVYNKVYKEGVVENTQLNDKVISWTEICVKQGLSVLILVSEINHGKILDGKLWTDVQTFIPHQFIWGTESTEVRANAITEFGNRTLPVLISSTILDEGVDVPTIDVLILPGSKKSKIRTLQRLGRGLRGDKLIVIEFSNFCHDYLLQHSLKRFQDYKNEDCFPLHSSAPDSELIKKLWQK